MKALSFLCLLLSYSITYGQQTYYDVTSGNGYGIRFWQHDAYKIHMGNTSEYRYGPVSDYSIKMNMSELPGRGWTWGVWNAPTPVASLSNVGNMQIAGKFTVTANFAPINFTSAWTSSPDNASNVSEISNDIGSYQQLMIVGNKAQGQDRRVGIWDRLSINNAGFAQILNVNGTGYFSGNVGIGKNSPATKLDLNGNFQVYPSGNSGTSGALKLRVIPGTFASVIEANSDFVWANHDIIINAANAVGGNLNQLVVHRSGRVGIGTATPDERLTVKGTIHAEEVKVDLNIDAPDYVFERNYELLALEDVEAFVTKNKHLPEVPSSDEMRENGVNLKEMNLLLLKKVEELTLYLIDQNNRISNLEKENATLKQSKK